MEDIKNKILARQKKIEGTFKEKNQDVLSNISQIPTDQLKTVVKFLAPNTGLRKEMIVEILKREKNASA